MDLICFHWGAEISCSISAAERALMDLICFAPQHHVSFQAPSPAWVWAEASCEVGAPVQVAGTTLLGAKGGKGHGFPHKLVRVILDAWGSAHLLLCGSSLIQLLFSPNAL